MLDWSSLFGLSSDPLKDSFLLYKRVTEQYENPEILKKVRSLIPQQLILKTKQDSDFVPLLKWLLVTAVVVVGQEQQQRQ